MYDGIMREEIERFVAALAIPEDRRLVVRAELIDHVECAIEAARKEGRDPEAAAREALGNLEALRRSLEAVEPAFRISRLHAFVRGVVASLVIAVVIDLGTTSMAGALGMITSLAVAIACAPPRALDMLRGELRARRVRGTVLASVPIGPALTYVFTVLSGPFVVWIAMIVTRAFGGHTEVDAPWSAFSVVAGGYLLLLVEGLRARRAAEA